MVSIWTPLGKYIHGGTDPWKGPYPPPTGQVFTSWKHSKAEWFRDSAKQAWLFSEGSPSLRDVHSWGYGSFPSGLWVAVWPVGGLRVCPLRGGIQTQPFYGPFEGKPPLYDPTLRGVPFPRTPPPYGRVRTPPLRDKSIPHENTRKLSDFEIQQSKHGIFQRGVSWNSSEILQRGVSSVYQEGSVIRRECHRSIKRGVSSVYQQGEFLTEHLVHRCSFRKFRVVGGGPDQLNLARKLQQAQCCFISTIYTMGVLPPWNWTWVELWKNEVSSLRRKPPSRRFPMKVPP